MPQPARRVAITPDLTQQDLLAELERKDEIIRKYAEDNSKLVGEVSGIQASARATGQVLDQVTKELAAQKAYAKSLQTKAGNRVVTDEQVETIVDHWCAHRPKTRRDESFPPDGKRCKLIESALKLMAGAEAGPVEACKEAIDGLHMAPWEAYGKRYAKHAPGRTLRNSLEHALGDETRIERCRGIVRWARADAADRAFHVWQVQQQVEQAWMRVWYEEYRHRQDPPEPPYDSFLVDGIVTRGDG